MVHFGNILSRATQGRFFFDLVLDATIDAVAKKEQKRVGENVTAGCSVTKTSAVTKPPYPIWYLNQK